jgi:hydroxymethylbilane synthase
VHSLKDLPTRQADGLVIAAVMDRAFPEDCLVCNGPANGIQDLPSGIRIGTSSLRRAAQVSSIRPDLQVIPIRGNVETRLARLDSGQVEAVLLARAGLERLGLAYRITTILDPRRFIPAPGQGALAVQVRSDDQATYQIASAIDDAKTRLLVEIERQVLVYTGCGCHAPLGAFAQIIEDTLHLYGFMADPQGKNPILARLTGRLDRPFALARQLANELLKVNR